MVKLPITVNASCPPVAGLCLLLICICGCPVERNGRIDHYQNGGSYIGCRPSIDPEHYTMLISTPTVGNGDLLLIDLTTQDVTNLTQSDEYEGDASFSPDYNRIAFVREINSLGSIWTMNVDGTDKRQHTFDSHYNHSPVYLSSREIVYCKEGGSYGDKRDQIWIVETSTNESRPLSSPSIQGSSPTVANERYVAFSRFDSGKLNLFLWDIEEQLLTSLGRGSNPVFSPDAKYLAFISTKRGDYEYDVCKIKIETKERTWITNTGGYKSYTSWPKDNYITYLDSTGTRGLGKVVRVELDGSSTEVLYHISEEVQERPMNNADLQD